MIKKFKQYHKPLIPFEDLKELPLNINPSDNMKKFLDELNTFELNTNDYAIFGSGPLAIRGIVEPSDLDIIVKPSKYKYNENPITIGNIELAKAWPGIDDIEKLINDSEFINGHPYVKLKYVEKYKNYMLRSKDDEHMISLSSQLLIDYIDMMKKKDNHD